jgi:hypothetical protein
VDAREDGAESVSLWGARAGRGSDARPWVEVLREGAAVPPNLRDCHFRLKPRAQCLPVPRATPFAITPHHTASLISPQGTAGSFNP